MSVVAIVAIAVAALVVLGVLGLVGLFILNRLSKRPGRAAVQRVAVEDLDRYFAKKAGFAVTVTANTPLSRREIFTRLKVGPYLSTLPFISGPDWLDENRGVGAQRTMAGTIFSVTEEVIVDEPGEEIALTGTAVCLPLTIKKFAERFRVAETDRGAHVVEWTIAGTPRFVGWLPWRWLAPLSRPVFAFVLRHVLRLKPFRPAR